MLLIHVQIHKLERRLAKVENELKRLTHAKEEEEEETTKDTVTRWNKDDQACSKNAVK
jgi:hypothetical protein